MISVEEESRNRKRLNFKKGQILLVDGIQGFEATGRYIIHVREVKDSGILFRLIATRKGMCTTRESQTSHAMTYNRSETNNTRVISNLVINAVKLGLSTYQEIKNHVADKYPEYFI